MRFARSVALSAAAMLVFTGCGSEGDPQAGDNPGSGSGNGSSAAPARTGPLSLPQLAESVDVQLAAKKSVKVTVSQDGAPATVTVSTRNGAPELALQIPPDENGGAVHVLRLRDGLYVMEETGGKPWVKFPTGSRNPQGQISAAMLGLAEAMIRTSQQKELLTAGGVIAGQVPEKVGSVDTTHYTVRVDVAKAVEKIDRKAFVTRHWALVQDIATGNRLAGAQQPATVTDAQADDLARRFARAMGGKPARYEFWVDAQGVPHKYTVTFPARKDTKATLTFAEWGTAQITPPPAGQVTVASDQPLGG
ncbi:hypothetical protein [Thermomonospora cellulosilytica]|uniref:Lipoprotein n=1 Tax=Thermomonospora cellulosilytica TaxID=1411118 RepID=A0A7W3R983_9ACTN|nr:hypothetical protein [Thermomonospora cellulosilytica]MBA9004095.1 hypothetical protein [Thermomonospora cellulosilytica]